MEGMEQTPGWSQNQLRQVDHNETESKGHSVQEFLPCRVNPFLEQGMEFPDVGLPREILTRHCELPMGDKESN